MKVALITGCSSGIGAAAARHFAAQGWSVAATMRKPSGALVGPSIREYALDVTDRATIEAAVKATLADFGRIDVLVNNAGYGLFGPFEPASDETIRRQFDTNLFGLFDVTRAVLPTLRAQKSGVIVNVSSIGGLTTFPMNSLYHANKYAVVGFTEALNYELHPFGIAAKVVCPGGVLTDFAGRSLALTFEGDGGVYAEGAAQTAAAFRRNPSRYSTSEQIAEGLFEAATDGTRNVRYVLGADAKERWAMRQKITDAQYLDGVEAWMRGA